MSDLSASEYISQQNALEAEARELMPWNPNHCTYVDGDLRQSLFACLDCNNIGLCYSCSIQCHAQCNLVELFTKRGFTCDCGTERQSQRRQGNSDYWCQLRQNVSRDIPGLSNVYGHNFEGRFCDCNTKYDPEHDSTMIQCVLGLECNEDWFHCACILETQTVAVKGESNDSRLNLQSDEELPRNFPKLESFDAFVCWKCISRYSSIFRDLLAHARSQEVVAHKVSHLNSLQKFSGAAKMEIDAKKRKLDDLDDTEGENPPFSIMFKEGYKDVLHSIKNELDKTSKLSVFLEEVAPFLTGDDPVYEPPDDLDDDASTFEMGAQALCSSVDRDVAVAGIKAMDDIKQKLSEFLRPFADSGLVVKEEDIRSFFQKHKEESQR
ncbi:LADA_0F09296g1_1 [Lachancea dasiensis]|uniref:LADA_0F09296g1_1 n=1 Tax=Lachancea dasiensis TaxID=1072105 RepID=A0A1G4JLE9_9SACH|nr:LADA_0F09296g1_1 [Lachancea dasiensis]